MKTTRFQTRNFLFLIICLLGMGSANNSRGIQNAGSLMTDPQGITAADMNIIDVTRPPFNAK
ncbi:MAG: hypothetical protein ACOC1J_03040, partial [Prolixibacteraceae bacterium]